jgi:dTDP-4-dehydrorhamnose reductase
MVNILITGCNGQLGSEFKVIAKDFPYFSFTFTDVEELDITDYKQVENYVTHHEPDVIINCAGYTAVDKAEDEPEKAMWLNRDAVANLARACDLYDCYLVHISTDYVFDGKNSRPYNEEDIPCPMTVYGLSKLAGEEALLSCLQKGMIIRTSWLYSSFGSNFVKTILRKSAELGTLNVVDDQVGCPTYARDLAAAILEIMPKALSMQQVEIYHYANEGECSWYEFAKAAVELAGIPCQVNPVTSDKYPQKAARPAYSVLDKTKMKDQTGITIPHWKESLRECLDVMSAKR